MTPDSLLSKHLDNHIPIYTWPWEIENARENIVSCNSGWRQKYMLGTFCASVVAALNVWH